VAATHDEATSTARGIEPGTVAAMHDEATLAARGIESTSPADTATVSSGSRFDLPSVDSATAARIAAALGAFGLAILGASFLSRRREPGAA
jgi:MYXO-CTERM domain-containing protein